MTKEKILCVDDDAVVLFSLHKDLEHRFTVTTAQSGEKALSLLQSNGPFSVIVADMIMPEMNGVELLAQAQRLAPDSVRMMLTGDEGKHTAVDAINEGQIFRFLEKPCAREKLVAALDAGVKQYRLVVAERELLEKTLNGSVNLLTELLAATEPDAFGRGQKVRDYVKAVAPALELASSWDVEIAALLAQIGLVAIPPTIMQKVRSGIALQEAEREMLNRVPEIGFKLLSKIPRLEPAAQIVLYQNKGVDGSGFPANLNPATQIPIGARLLRAVSDLLDLESKGNPRRKAFEEMRRMAQCYHPRVLEAVFHNLVEAAPAADARAVAVKDLVAGCELVSAIETTDGMMIAPIGAKLSDTMIERVQNFAKLIGIREPIHVKFTVK